MLYKWNTDINHITKEKIRKKILQPSHTLVTMQVSVQKHTPRMLSSSVDATQLKDPHSLEVHPRGANSHTDPSHIPPSTVQVQTDSRHPVENSARKFSEIESFSDSDGMQVSQMPPSCVVASDQERECSSVPTQVFNKPQQQQQQLHYSESSLSMHGNAGGTFHPYSGTRINTSALPVKQQPFDAQPRQSLQHQSMGSAQSGGQAHGMNIISMSKMGSQNSMNDPSRLEGGSCSHLNNNATLEQNPGPCKSSNKEQSSDPLSSMAYVKQGSFNQTIRQQHNPSLPDSQGLPSVSAALLEQGNASSGIPMNEVLEKSSRLGASTSVSIAPSSSKSTLPTISVSPSLTMQVNPSVSLGPRITSGTSPSGACKKTLPKKRSLGQNKPLETLGSSPSQSSKKQKVSGTFVDIAELNDVTSVSGVNLEEEEELLFSGPKKHSKASEASRKFVQEEEERLILQKAPLQKKIGEIMVKCGLKSVRHDVERCLSMCVEERMRRLINTLILLSKQWVDAEKSRHHTITTSDVRQQIIDLNRKPREERKKKRAEAEKLWKLNETNKKDNDKMRTAAAANVAALAAVGGDDMFSKWKLMAQARKQRDGEIDVASRSQPVQGVNRTPTSTAGRIMESQEAEKKGVAAPVAAAATSRKAGSNQVTTTQTRMARSISVKDMIVVLEREPQMSKSTLLYRLHERIQSDTAIASSN
ncbi:transcription initiation factor TFIID subunit 4b-like isoform X4 [Malus sylvestris]|uniref:transcription initiation factor TFIID subunit 4b-like isoform X4 n=1 Tax=Malus sylvestris TaxID=3752 RepID=UPI0021ACD9C2|nr:transcription initiation factor TFIID subunit 4b-like isoform X4 [Malus sylvestris]